MSSQSEINERLLFGEKGLLILSAGESSTTEKFSCIHVLEASTITVLKVSNSSSINSLEVPAGIPLYGIFSEITVVSGKIIAYKR
tara:strand:+ start:113 stop:367 length:255 start_codon:yes stop_codon:yes gene_type:complete